MWQFIGIALFLCMHLFILGSCGDSTYQVRQPRGYGEMPPGETWVAVGSTYQSPSREMVYYDPTTIRRDGNLVTLWQLTDYKLMQGNASLGVFMMSPHRFFSTKAHKKFDCARNSVRMLASSEFSEHMGAGTHNAVLVSQDQDQPVERGSIDQALWEVSCGTTKAPSEPQP